MDVVRNLPGFDEIFDGRQNHGHRWDWVNLICPLIGPGLRGGRMREPDMQEGDKGEVDLGRIMAGNCWMLGMLTHLPLGKMAAILADNIFRCIFMNEMFCILIRISLKFVPRGPIDNRPALVQVMAWCQIGDKPLSEPMWTQFTDACICDTRERWVKEN